MVLVDEPLCESSPELVFRKEPRQLVQPALRVSHIMIVDLTEGEIDRRLFSEYSLEYGIIEDLSEDSLELATTALVAKVFTDPEL